MQHPCVVVIVTKSFANVKDRLVFREAHCAFVYNGFIYRYGIAYFITLGSSVIVIELWGRPNDIVSF